MAYRNLTDIDDKMLRAIWQLGARDGVKKVTARKVAALCGVSDYTVFCHFGGGNRGFWDAAARYFFDCQIEPFLDRLAEHRSVGDIWDDALDTFLREPDGATYFLLYRTAFGLSPELFPMEKLRKIGRVLTASMPPMSEEERLLQVDLFFSLLFSYTERFSRGEVSDAASLRAFLRALICRSFCESETT